MKKSLIALAALAAVGLSGCVTLDYAGHAAYEIKANAAGGYDLKANDGKEFAEGRTIAFDAKKGQLMVQEGPSRAFKGQGIAGKVATGGLADVANIVAGDKDK